VKNGFRFPVLFVAVVCALLLFPFGRARAEVDVSGRTVTVAADATDNRSVVGVQFLLDGAPLGAEDRSPPWSVVWDTTTVPDGTYRLSARARDAAGNSATAIPVVVRVGNARVDDLPPAVVTISPVGGQIVAGSTPVEASATDDDGVAGVQFFVDGMPLSTEDTSPPYRRLWDTTFMQDGIHVLTATARDTAGKLAHAAPVAVYVDNQFAGAGSPPPAPPDPDDPQDPAPGTPPDTDPADPGESAAGDNPDPVRTPVPPGDTRLTLSVSRDALAISQVQVDYDLNGLAGLELAIDGEVRSSTSGTLLGYRWDARNLMGFHEVRAVNRDAGGVVASASILHKPSVSGNASVTMTLNPLPLIGATFIRAENLLTGVRKTELYIDGSLRQVVTGGDSIDFGWNTRDASGAHEILVVAYDDTGVLASLSVYYRPR
jgi:hypothetical protein